MGYESALQRVGELRSMTGGDPMGSTTGTTAAPAGAFEAQLLQQQQQAMLGAAGGSTASAESPLAEYGVPILTVADQYRMMGSQAPPVGLPAGFPGTGGSAVGQQMVALAQREIGNTETGGNNESVRIREYRSATAGAENTPGPWCAYFVSWRAKSAGAPIGAGGNGTGYVPTLEAWGKQENRFVEFGSQQPQAGDIVIFDWTGDNTSDHTGIVERVDPDGTIHTIEGNASDKVMRRDYSSSTNDIRGYVRPG